VNENKRRLVVAISSDLIRTYPLENPLKALVSFLMMMPMKHFIWKKKNLPLKFGSEYREVPSSN
jgi:hypothetical protein